MSGKLVITLRNIPGTGEIESCIRERFSALEAVETGIAECTVYAERTNQYARSGNPFRVRLTVKLNGHPEIVVKREPNGFLIHDPLSASLHNAFTIARRKIGEARDREQNIRFRSKDIRFRPQAEYGAIVAKIFQERGYGFLQTESGRNVFFHRSSVVGDEFEQMVEGMGVWFIEREGDRGPWASTVLLYTPAS